MMLVQSLNAEDDIGPSKPGDKSYQSSRESTGGVLIIFEARLYHRNVASCPDCQGLGCGTAADRATSTSTSFMTTVLMKFEQPLSCTHRVNKSTLAEIHAVTLYPCILYF
jgi:hypothetical protein